MWGRRRGAAWAVGCLFAWGCGNTQLRKAEASLEVLEPGLDWGLVALGDAVPRSLTLHNDGLAPVTVTVLSVPAPFQVREFPAGGVTLTGGEQRQFAVVFAPVAEGAAQASATIDADDGQGPRSVSLKGEGVKVQVEVSPVSLAFGQVPLGQSTSRDLELHNLGRLAVRVAVSLDGPDVDEFASADAAQAIEVAPGAVRTVSVEFKPDHLGIGEAVARVVPCPTCAPVAVALGGEGVASCIDIDPESLDFGSVEVGVSVSRPVAVVNSGTTPVNVVEVFLASSTSPDFAFQGFVAGTPRRLEPGARLPLAVSFKPSSNGARQGALRIRAEGLSGGDGCWAQIRLRGSGGKGCLAVDPTAIDFGLVAAGMSGQRTVFVANAACGADVQLDALQVAGDAFLAGASKPPPFVLRQGEVVELAVRFNPPAPGQFQGTLHLSASDASSLQPLSQPPADVTLKGQSRGLAPCDFSVSPPRIDFGTVGINEPVALAVRIANLGNDSCYFSNLGLAAGTSSVFNLDGASPGFVLDANQTHEALVKLNATSAGSFAGALEMYVSDPAAPYRTYPIAAQAEDGCLSIDPEDIDFGTVFVGCPPPTRTTTLSNHCAGDVTLQSLVKGQGTSSAFSLPGAPAFPVVLNPSASLGLTVQYAPQGDGLDSMPLYVDDGTARRLIAVRGRGVKDPWRTDAFDQIAKQKVDVLFVLDNSGSMADKQAAVAANLRSFLASAQSQGVDYHLAVTTTGLIAATGGWTSCPGGVDGGEAGRLFPADNSSPRILTPQTVTPDAVWASMTTVGTCHWLEQGMEASYRALTPPLVDHADDPRTELPNDGNLGFYRNDAKLTVVYISDEDDQSDATVDFYLRFLRSLKADPSLLGVSAVVTPADGTACPNGTSPGVRYTELATKLGGVVESICTPDWSASLSRIGANTFGLTAAFPLSAVPSDASKITVTVNGADVSSTANWTYDAANNVVIFFPWAVPGAGSHVEIRYPLGCS